jgi:hypothetical protein
MDNETLGWGREMAARGELGAFHRRHGQPDLFEIFLVV